MPAQLVGRNLGKSRILAEIGRGGMAVVFKAKDTGPGRPVAVELRAPDLSKDKVYTRRLRDEARVVALLPHPHIVTLYDVAHDGGKMFLVMQSVEVVSPANTTRREAPHTAGTCSGRRLMKRATRF